MNSDKKNKVGAARSSAFSQMERTHPIRVLLYLSMAGMLLLFMILVVAYGHVLRITPDNGTHISFPKFFNLSTIIVLVSCFLVRKLSKAYRKDNIPKLKKMLGFLLLAGFGFMGTQLMAWNEIAQGGLYFNTRSAGAFIYLISALHLFHLVGGLVFLMYLFFKTNHVASDAVRTLIFIRDPFRLLQLRLMAVYWQFLAGLWMGLYILFLFMF